MNTHNGNARERKLRVGDRVRFQFGIETVEGVIVEDRGLLGVGGRRIWAIEFPFNLGEPGVIELPEKDILPAT